MRRRRKPGHGVSGAADEGEGAAYHPPASTGIGARAADDGALPAVPELQLSDQLLQLMPPPPPGGWSVRMPPTPPATEWLRRWEYPPVRRAQRLSYMIAACLPTIDRARLLHASSVRERLQISIVALSETRRRLAARAALEPVVDDAPPPDGLDAFGI